MKNKQIVIILWFFHIYKPIWALSYFIPAFGKFLALPRIFLYLFFIYFLFISSKKFKYDKPFIIFCISLLLSTIFAYNVGISRKILDGYIDYCILFTLCLTIIDDETTFEKFYNIYLTAFFYYCIWGILNRGLVPYHPFLGDEDAFGPYMAIGAIALYFTAFAKVENRKKLFGWSLICVCGVVISFARGALVGLTTGLLYVFIYSKHKIATFLALAVTITAALSVSILYFGGDKYLNEMKTITSASSKTEGDRVFYWKKAVEMYKDHPMIGVGPRNYGIMLPKYVSRKESMQQGMFSGYWYGRVPHSLYFQLVAEQGIVGIICLVYVLYIFSLRTSITKLKRVITDSSDLSKQRYYCLALRGAMLLFLITGMFYDFLYSSLLFELVLLAALRESVNNYA